MSEEPVRKGAETESAETEGTAQQQPNLHVYLAQGSGGRLGCQGVDVAVASPFKSSHFGNAREELDAPVDTLRPPRSIG